MNNLNAFDLKAFEEGIAAEFNAGKIRYPVHLESGNEDALIEVFQEVRPQDWVFGTWRLHLKALLKGVSRETLRAAIHRGESMALRFDDERVYGSAIVTGTISIALGCALAVKRQGKDELVWCFLGDMAAETGAFHEALKYANNWSLPIRFVIEDNGVSVCTDTRKTWGTDLDRNGSARRVRRFHYHSKWPHAGAGERVQF